MKMSCIHLICAQCLEEEIVVVLSKGNEKLIEQIRCPKYDELIQIQVIEKALGINKLGKVMCSIE